jgi:hypothetical protein
MRRWRATIGTSVPIGPQAMAQWLDEHPDQPQARWARVELLGVVGRLEEARAVLARMPVETAFDRFEQRSLAAYIDWLEGGQPDLISLRRNAEDVGEPGSPDRIAAEAAVAIAEARELAAAGGDWTQPLIGVRERVGPEAGRLLREDTYGPRLRRLLLVGYPLCAVILFVSGQLP